MTIIRVRLCEADRKEYGIDGEPLPEEMTLDVEGLVDLRARELVALDRALGMPVKLFFEPLLTWSLNVAEVAQVAAFLAAHQAGSPVKFDDFDPRLGRAELVREASDAPLAGASERSSEAPTPRRSSSR
ncbi:hypothetical protein [Micromonospora sp. CB01531]|uniref:hypothetical protein n=1 Tax=Micromonospora sp. CB01531 TaxID=1718947 RepID=UPI00093AF4B9|nr:hypothetical protein [Micromonospora sp. CB01531]OKI47309.1 hypothetical protein A6A27_10705 [Micromonospora sp. CB01531]